MEYYVDHNATTPMCQDAIAVMVFGETDNFGNPSSVHAAGHKARTLLEDARETLSGLIGCDPSELYFTSGGTEANNWAIRGILEDRQHWGMMLSAVEHKSVINAAAYMTFLIPSEVVPVDETGVIKVDALKSALFEYDEWLISVMLANNETGVIQPIRDVMEVARRESPDSLVHVDAVQAFGKIPVDVRELGVDLMSISAHKLGGPKGIGALYVRDGIPIAPFLYGGHQERDRRAGTENAAAAAAFAIAAQNRLANMADFQKKTYIHVRTLLGKLIDGLDDIWVNGSGCERLPNTLNVGFKGVESDSLVLVLSMQDIFVSNGSACESGSLEGSHVLQAMGQTEEQARSAIRFSFSDDLTAEDVEHVATCVIQAVNEIRNMDDAIIP